MENYIDSLNSHNSITIKTILILILCMNQIRTYRSSCFSSAGVAQLALPPSTCRRSTEAANACFDLIAMTQQQSSAMRINNIGKRSLSQPLSPTHEVIREGVLRYGAYSSVFKSLFSMLVRSSSHILLGSVSTDQLEEVQSFP